MTQALVVGASGQLGPAVCSALRERGWDVVALARRNLPGHLLLPAPWTRAALRALLKEHRINLIVNLAGAGVRPGQDHVMTLVETNVTLPSMLVEAAANCGCPVVNIGSGAEYDCVGGGHALDETTPINTAHPYGLSKAAGGLAALSLALASETPFVHLRLFGAYGENEASYRLLPSLVLALSRSEPVSLSDGRQVRDWLYERDIGDGVATVAEAVGKRAIASGLYNLGSGEGHSVREFAQEVGNIMGTDPELLCFGNEKRRQGEVERLVADTTKLHAVTGWRPRHSWREGLREAITKLSGRLTDEAELKEP